MKFVHCSTQILKPTLSTRSCAATMEDMEFIILVLTTVVYSTMGVDKAACTLTGTQAVYLGIREKERHDFQLAESCGIWVLNDALKNR